MTVIRVERPASDRAIVWLRPSWWARLWGAKTLRRELHTQKHCGDDIWHAASGRRLDISAEHGKLLLAALDASPVDDVELARAEVRS